MTIKKASQLYDDKYELIEKKEIIPNRYKIIKKEIIEHYFGDQKILDIGCGEGQLLMMLKNSKYKLYGIDASKKAVDICKKKGLEVYLKDIGDETKFHIPVDIIISADTLEHIFDHYHFLSYINLSLKQNAIFILAVPNSNQIGQILKYLKGETPTSLQNPLHIRFFSLITLIDLADCQGFDYVKNLSQSILPNHPFLNKFVMINKNLSILFSSHLIIVLKKRSKPVYNHIEEIMNKLRKKWYNNQEK